VREWACYWTVLATLYCLQPFIDLVLSWLPFYYVAKVTNYVILSKSNKVTLFELTAEI
jgi:hypothetical protein